MNPRITTQRYADLSLKQSSQIEIAVVEIKFNIPWGSIATFNNRKYTERFLTLDA